MQSLHSFYKGKENLLKEPIQIQHKGLYFCSGRYNDNTDGSHQTCYVTFWSAMVNIILLTFMSSFWLTNTQYIILLAINLHHIDKIVISNKNCWVITKSPYVGAYFVLPRNLWYHAHTLFDQHLMYSRFVKNQTKKNKNERTWIKPTNGLNDIQ